MRVTIQFETDNDAFQGRMLQGEVLRILHQASKHIGEIHASNSEEVEMKLQDSNGNTVGYVQVRK